MKYPRTFHLPYSLGGTNDDKVLDNDQCFQNKIVIYTEKLDGECVSLLCDKIHARSEESQHHPSQSWIKSLHAKIAYKIPENIQIVGENMYAKHSIYYQYLTTYFYVFAIIDISKSVFLSVSSMASMCDSLHLEMVPMLGKCKYDPKFVLQKYSRFGDEIEGYVIRTLNEFSIDDMSFNIAKFVRKNHVKTDDHWRTSWIPNKLAC